MVAPYALNVIRYERRNRLKYYKKGKNNFSEETRALFANNNFNCWKCNRSDKGLSTDHIMGRGLQCSNSPYNLAPLCISPCHANKKSSDQPKLLKKARNFLERENYRNREDDLIFLEQLKLWRPEVYKASYE